MSIQKLFHKFYMYMVLIIQLLVYPYSYKTILFRLEHCSYLFFNLLIIKKYLLYNKKLFVSLNLFCRSNIIYSKTYFAPITKRRIHNYILITNGQKFGERLNFVNHLSDLLLKKR